MKNVPIPLSVGLLASDTSGILIYLMLALILAGIVVCVGFLASQNRKISHTNEILERLEDIGERLEDQFRDVVAWRHEAMTLDAAPLHYEDKNRRSQSDGSRTKDTLLHQIKSETTHQSKPTSKTSRSEVA